MGTVMGTIARKGVFLREATGLVREMNTFDVLAMNSFNISAGLGLAFVLYVGPSVFFDANIPLGVLLATLGGLAGALTFALLTAMVPRSVTDYVLVTRTIHPALGFATNWTWVFWNVVWAGILTSFVTNWALYDLFAIYGTMNNVPWMYDLAFSTTSNVWTLYPQSSILNIFLGTIIIAAFGVMLSVGPKVFLYFQRIVFVVGVIGLITALGVMATTTNAQFITNWNNYASTWATNPADYNAVAAQAGGSSKSLALLATIGIIPVASWSLAYGQATTAVGGEIRRPNRNLPLGASLSVLLAGGIMGIGAILFLNVVGKDFLSGAVNSYIATLGGSTTTPWYGFYPAPYFDLFVSIANPNPIVTLLVGIGFICWILYYPGLDCLMNTRAVLAWSFDRLGPSWLGKVSDRFHTPIRAVAVFSVLNWLALVIFSLNFSLTGSLSATLAVFVTMFLFMGIVGLVFPYLRKTKPIFESSAVKWKIGPVPVLTITAIGWVLFLLVGTIYYLTEPGLAAYSPLMLTISAIVFFAAFPIYYIVKAYRKGKGFDITLAYAEIPPE